MAVREAPFLGPRGGVPFYGPSGGVLHLMARGTPPPPCDKGEGTHLGVRGSSDIVWQGLHCGKGE